MITLTGLPARRQLTNRFVLLVMLIALPAASSVFAQDVFQEYDDIDSTRVGDIFFWPQRGLYLAVMHHSFYRGPTMGPPGQNNEIKVTEYVLELNRNTGATARSSVQPAWVRKNLATSRLPEAKFATSHYETNTGVIWRIGPFQITEATVKDLPLAEIFYDGFQGDIVYVHGEWVTFGDAGYMDHSSFAPAVFRPEPDMNYWELNRQGYLKYQQQDYAGAANLFGKSLEINPDFQHSNYNLACMYSLLKRPFAEGRPYLERLLKDPQLKAYYLKKIPADADLAFWIEGGGFNAWLAEFR